MNYNTAIEFLYSLQNRGVKLGLERMQAALEMRGNPHHDLRFVHVAGTNGKGSVSAMLASCLMHAGFKTGLFTSPHLHHFTERIRIDGQELSQTSAARRIEELRGWFRTHKLELSFFETTTLMAFEAFREASCEMVVMETGLGGRLDSTNVINPELCIITHIAYDHCDILGHELGQIASEKAGIIKPSIPVIIGESAAEATCVLLERAQTMNAPVALWDRDIHIKAEMDNSVNVMMGRELVSDIRVPLPGLHQKHNAALAASACVLLRNRGWNMPDAAIRRGIQDTTWPGRLERIGENPLVVLDAAHNPDSCQVLAQYVSSIREAYTHCVLVFGCMKDKNAKMMLACFDGVVDTRLYVTPPMSRAMRASNLQMLRNGTACDSTADALMQARHAAGEGGVIIVAGSIFLMAEARSQLLQLPTEPLIGM